MVLLTGALVVVVGSGMSGGAARLAGRNTASKKGHMVAPSMAALRQQSLSFCYGCRRLQAQGVEGHVLGDVLDAGNPLGILLALELHTQSRIRWT